MMLGCFGYHRDTEVDVHVCEFLSNVLLKTMSNRTIIYSVRFD